MSQDTTENTPVAFPQGGASIEVGTVGGVAGAINLNSGGILNLAAGALIQDAGVSRPASITFSPAAGAANICLVTLTFKDAAGVALAGVFNFDLWLSDAATGAGLTATTASGAVAAGANGADLGDYTAKKAKRVQTKADGTYILSITDTGKTLFFVCAQLINGRATASAQLITGNYG